MRRQVGTENGLLSLLPASLAPPEDYGQGLWRTRGFLILRPGREGRGASAGFDDLHGDAASPALSIFRDLSRSLRDRWMISKGKGSFMVYASVY